MTTNQIMQLKALGYTNTQEDGAILQHPQLMGMNQYVWEDEKFIDVLAKFTPSLTYAVAMDIGNSIKNSFY